MTVIPGVLESLVSLNPALAIVGSLTSIAALGMAIFAIQRSLAHASRMKKEHAKNTAFLKHTLDGCHKTISRVLKMKDKEQYYRSLGALSLTLTNALTRYEIHVRQDARQAISDMSLLLLDTATHEHAESIKLLENVQAIVEMPLENIITPRSGLNAPM